METAVHWLWLPPSMPMFCGVKQIRKDMWVLDIVLNQSSWVWFKFNYTEHRANTKDRTKPNSLRKHHLISFLSLKSNQLMLIECLLCTKRCTQPDNLRGLFSLHPNTFQSIILTLDAEVQYTPCFKYTFKFWNKPFKLSETQGVLFCLFNDALEPKRQK